MIFPELPESWNCQQFDDLKARWQLGSVDKNEVRRSFPIFFPDNHEKIIAWLDRPIKPGEHNIYTKAKFDE